MSSLEENILHPCKTQRNFFAHILNCDWKKLEIRTSNREGKYFPKTTLSFGVVMTQMVGFNLETTCSELLQSTKSLAFSSLSKRRVLIYILVKFNWDFKSNTKSYGI